MTHPAPPRRDLKLDNTLLDDQKPPVIKLCDVRAPARRPALTTRMSRRCAHACRPRLTYGSS